jgi:hypothetical protein
MRTVVACLAVLTSAALTRADYPDDLIVRCREARFVVLGRVAKVHSTEHPQGVPGVGIRATATIQVERHLKGDSTIEAIEIEFRAESYLDFKPDTEDVIWFVRGRQDDGRYAVVDWKWGKDSLRTIEWAMSLVDKQARIPGMPRAQQPKGALTLALGADDGTGRAATSIRVASPADLKLLVQFENHELAPRAVMPCLDGSDCHRRYPHYDLEVLDANGLLVRRGGFAVCGNIDPFRALDIVPLRQGEVFRTRAPFPWHYRMSPGRYRVRLRYTAKKDLRLDGIPLGKNDPQVADAIKTVWEGQLISNWVEVEVTGKPKDPSE